MLFGGEFRSGRIEFWPHPFLKKAGRSIMLFGGSSILSWKVVERARVRIKFSSWKGPGSESSLAGVDRQVRGNEPGIGPPECSSRTPVQTDPEGELEAPGRTWHTISTLSFIQTGGGSGPQGGAQKKSAAGGPHFSSRYNMRLAICTQFLFHWIDVDWMVALESHSTKSPKGFYFSLYCSQAGQGGSSGRSVTWRGLQTR